MEPPTDADPLDILPLPGLTLTAGGADFSVFASHATAVWFCVFDGDAEHRIALTQRSHGWWYGHLAGVGPGTRYALRADGPWEPQKGHRHNAVKLLLDPYAKALDGQLTIGEEIYGHRVREDWTSEDDEIRSDLDSASQMPRCVVIDDSFDWGEDLRPHRPLSRSVIYEAHVRELTMQHPDIPEHLRGTYAGVAHPAMITHLQRIGVTAIELLPIHAYVDEPHLVRLGLTNHWGYNTVGFFAPHGPYAAAANPQEQVTEVKGMIKALHRAGIEVLLDVVYNHTAEQSVAGATLSWRGLDAASYYRLDERGRDVDVTGCGGTLDLRHPAVARMVLDSLRYWATEYHVDGFRFDLAIALARGEHDDYDPHHPFLTALRTDPVLSQVTLIAEPWDVGPHGWRTGQLPHPFSEWNDRFRDSVRAFWLQDLGHQLAHDQDVWHGVSDLATRLAGSEDVFGTPERGPEASINFVTAHDGFTLADLTAYNHKHNEQNGEDNRDGTTHNLSWNHGVEGPSDDPAVLTLRRRSVRNLLGTLLVATGVPMIASGDELGRTTRGNNNPYALDSPVSWIDWDLRPWQQNLIATTAHLTQLRRTYATLRQRRFFTGNPITDDGSTDIAWYDSEGHLMGSQWGDRWRRTLQMYLNGAHLGYESVLVVLHGDAYDGAVVLPSPPGLVGYRLLWDSAWERPDDGGQPPFLRPQAVPITGASMRIYAAIDPT